jgi:hypothetical protein
MKKHLGMAPGELAGRPYAEFWNPEMVPLSRPVREAIARGSVATALLPALSDSTHLLEQGDQPVENGWSRQSDGALHLAIRTEMPGTSPDMVDWWFGWHSAEPARYKLWHPQAHVHARWAGADPSGLFGRDRYVGRTSIVDEFVGPREGQYAIQFVPPSALGLIDHSVMNVTEGTAICARVRFAGYPVQIGSLVHHVRAVPGGSVMRSRFWIGGRNAGGQAGSRWGDVAARLGRLFMKPTDHDLLVHCAQEMTHLASFLPALYARCQDLH